MSRCSIALAVILAGIATTAQAAPQRVWKFDNFSHIGGLTPKVEGAPVLVDSPIGKAVQFNGKDDALFFSDRPLVGAKTFTIEGIFRPEGGEFEQRWMHVVETDPVNGLDAQPSISEKGVATDANPRFMFEVRVKDGNWWLDGFINSKAGSKALIDPAKTHPVGPWYAVQQTYDGKTYRTYVNGVLENEGEVAFTPHGAGHVMVGVRVNHVNWFKGSVAELRFTPQALKPVEFLKVPVQ